MEGQVHLVISSTLETANLPSDLMSPATDVRHVIKDQLGIADARDLVELSSRTSLSSETYSFVIVTKSITTEAQNALLKLLEEPPKNTSIYLVVPHESLLIPTLRSRFITAESVVAEIGQDVDAQIFLTTPIADRLALIASKAKQKDTLWLETMVLNLGKVVTSSPEVPLLNVYKALGLAESYVRIRGASRKMLLEELALSLPVKNK